MWKRVQLKEKAKASFKRNYWRSVLVALLVAVLVGGGAGGSAIGSTIGAARGSRSSTKQRTNVTTYDQYDIFNDWGGNYPDWDIDTDPEDADFFDDFSEYGYGGNPFEYNAEDGTFHIPGVGRISMQMLIVIFIICLIAVLIGISLAIVMDVLLFNPIEVGTRRFFYRNLNEPAEIKETAYGFDHNYKNVVETMFFRGLYTFLWSLLFVIPGIVKSYEYCMIPYILAEHPDMPREQAFSISRQMMDGQKWNTFVLDLSFILWDILGAITLGLVNLFYVGPYKNATYAALYETLKFQNGQPYDALYHGKYISDIYTRERI